MNYLYYQKDISYPKPYNAWGPSEQYPEYSFGYLNNEDNEVYDAIRSMFIDMGLDSKNIGSKNWNPLGEYIKPGQKVLIKPNFVMHKNGSDNPDDMESLVTHPSILRCIIDYCLIALNGSGSLLVADSPVKDCDFKQLMINGGYELLVEFYAKVGVTPMPAFFDLRGPEEEGGQYSQGGEGILVNLGERSFHYNSDIDYTKYRIPNYDYRKVISHHIGEKQEYMINSLILDADVIVSLPKPKTHRKSGYTGALKNFIGVCYSKEYLPHHTAGGLETGGDEYKVTNGIRIEQTELRNELDIIRCELEIKRKEYLKLIKDSEKEMLMEEIKHLEKRQYDGWMKWSELGRKDDILLKNSIAPLDERAREGAWHGNNTLWRTVLDMNVAVEYADKNGMVHPDLQRKILYIGDMIVSGEKEGPLAPSPKKVGAILFSENPVEFDCILVKLMGFDWEKFPGLKNAVESELLFKLGYKEIEVLSNNKYCIGNLENVKFENLFDVFDPSSGWKGYVELEER